MPSSFPDFLRQGPGALAQTERRLRLALVLLAVVLAAGIGSASLLSHKIGQISNDFKHAQVDNQTWRVAQLETEFQRFILGLAADGPLSAEAWGDIVTRFDIYYSRTQTQRVMLDGMQDLLSDPVAAAGAMERIMANRDALAAAIDAIGQPTPAQLAGLRATALAGYADVRGLVVQVRDAISRQAQATSDIFTLLLWLGRRALITLGITLVLFGGVVGIFYLRIVKIARQLARARENLQTIISSSPDAIVICDHRGRIVEFNDTAHLMVGHRRQDVLGKDVISAFLVPRMLRRLVTDHPVASRSGLVRRAAGRRLRVVIRARDGHGIFAEVTSALVAGPGGDLPVIFVRDISDSVRAARQLRRARSRAEQSAVAKDRFLSVMSHEMRSPLHGVIAALDLLGGEPDPRECERLIKVARSSADSAIRQIDDVLEVARLSNKTAAETPGIFVPARVAEELVEQHAILADRRGTRIVTEAGPGTAAPRVGQARTFRRALSNLLSNACKFTSDGEVHLRLRDAGDDILRIEVEDSGHGIPADRLPRIFEDFFTTDADGSVGAGLGLPIVAAAVRAMNGRLGVHSTEGEGSLFWIEIPLPPADRPEPGEGDAPALSVLIVDDIETNRDLLARMTVRLGHLPVVAEDGAAAVAIAAQARFDVVLMDIRMPGMDGFAASRAIRAGGLSQGARIYGVTAHIAHTPAEDRAAAEVGLSGILRKPVTIPDVAGALRPGSAVRSAPAAAVVLDPARLREVRALADGDWLGGLTGAFFSELADIAGRLAGPPGPHAALADAAHHAAGTAAVLGCVELRALLARIEDGARLEGLPDPEALAAALTAAGRRAFDELGKALARG